MALGLLMNDEEEETGPKKKKRKMEGEHTSRTKQNLFYDLFTRVLEARKDEVSGIGWDRSLQDEANQRITKNKKMQGVEKNIGIHPSPKDAGTQYVARYSPGKAMCYEKVMVQVHV